MINEIKKLVISASTSSEKMVELTSAFCEGIARLSVTAENPPALIKTVCAVIKESSEQYVKDFNNFMKEQNDRPTSH